MTTINAKAIRETLVRKGVIVSPPAAAATLEKLAQWIGRPVHPDVIQILLEFDGFADDAFEAISFVSVWPIDKALSDDWTKHPQLAFSDWSLNAMIFGFDPSRDGPVFSIEDSRTIASSYAEFWTRLLSDQLL